MVREPRYRASSSRSAKSRSFRCHSFVPFGFCSLKNRRLWGGYESETASLAMCSGDGENGVRKKCKAEGEIRRAANGGSLAGVWEW